MRLPDLIKIQCSKSASQLRMLELVFEVMIMERAPNCFDQYEYIKLDAVLNILKKIDSLQNTDVIDWLLHNS